MNSSSQVRSLRLASSPPPGAPWTAGAATESPADNARVDAELVRRTLAGDPSAFAQLVDRYERRAFWIAYHVVGDVEEARDVTQESFLRVYRSLDSFDFARNFYTWFYRIVMNLAIDRLRKVAAGRAARLDDVAHALSAGDADATASSEHGETRSLVWRVLDQLDPKFRAVLVLRDIHGLSCQEIAPVLRVTHATVRWRLCRGRKLFKEQWERRTRGWT